MEIKCSSHLAGVGPARDLGVGVSTGLAFPLCACIGFPYLPLLSRADAAAFLPVISLPFSSLAA